MRLNEIFKNFFNRVFNKEKTIEPESLPERTMVDSLKYITGEQLFERKKEQYRAIYNAQITKLLLENKVNPILAKNKKMSSIINDRIGLFVTQINKLKEEIDFSKEYSISEVQKTIDINENVINTIKQYISNITIEDDGSRIQMPNDKINILEEYEVFNQGIMCNKMYYEKGDIKQDVIIKEVINPNGKYIARHTNIIERGLTLNLDEYTKKTVIDSFKNESYAKEGYYIKEILNGEEKKLENFGQSQESIESNISYTKEKACQTAKKIFFYKNSDSQNENKNGLVNKIKQNVMQRVLPGEQKDPKKYYITDEAEKYFDDSENFESRAAQLLGAYQIQHELDN